MLPKCKPLVSKAILAWSTPRSMSAAESKEVDLSDGKCRWPETMSRGRRRRKGRTPDSPM